MSATNESMCLPIDVVKDERRKQNRKGVMSEEKQIAQAIADFRGECSRVIELLHQRANAYQQDGLIVAAVELSVMVNRLGNAVVEICEKEESIISKSENLPMT